VKGSAATPQDLAANLYDSYYINFLSPVPGALLNQLAAASIQTEAVTKIAKVSGVAHRATLVQQHVALTRVTPASHRGWRRRCTTSI